MTLGGRLRTVFEMLRTLAGAMVLVTASAAPAFAAGPDPTPVPSGPPVPGVIASPPPAPAGHGALVVAISDEASGAAHALALDVYRDADLRPSIDDATARVLAGEAPAADAAQKLKDVADVRATLAKSSPDGGPRRRPARRRRPVTRRRGASSPRSAPTTTSSSSSRCSSTAGAPSRG